MSGTIVTVAMLAIAAATALYAVALGADASHARRRVERAFPAPQRHRVADPPVVVMVAAAVLATVATTRAAGAWRANWRAADWYGRRVEDTRTSAARTHFDRWSETYEQDSAARWLREVQTQALAALALNADDVLLDVGCGTGAAVREAAPTIARAVGFDLSPGMIAQARTRAGAEGLDQRRVPRGRRERTAAVRRRRVHRARVHHRVSPLPATARTRSPRCPGCWRPAAALVIADANRRHPAVFALDLALRVAQPSHAGFRSPAQLMHDLAAAGLQRVSFCTTRWRSFAFVRAEKAPR